jgi:hypothetical protein
MPWKATVRTFACMSSPLILAGTIIERVIYK